MTQRTLIIGNKNYSSWSLRPWLVLRKAGLDFQEKRVVLTQPDFKETLKQQGMLGGLAGKVPILLDGENSIWESQAICEYLAESNPELWPKDPATRALARAMVAEMHAGFTALRHELPMNCRAEARTLMISAAALQDIQRIETLWETALRSKPVEGPWLFGTFSITDAFFAPVALRFYGYRVPLQEHTRAYIKQWLDDPDLTEWRKAGQAEHEIILEEEVGDE